MLCPFLAGNNLNLFQTFCLKHLCRCVIISVWKADDGANLQLASAELLRFINMRRSKAHRCAVIFHSKAAVFRNFAKWRVSAEHSMVAHSEYFFFCHNNHSRSIFVTFGVILLNCCFSYIIVALIQIPMIRRNLWTISFLIHEASLTSCLLAR